jgi:hypothetical protein
MRRLRFQITAADKVAAFIWPTTSFPAVSQSSCRQVEMVETGLTVREGADDAASAPDFFHDPLQRIVGSNLLPVNVGKAIVG